MLTCAQNDAKFLNNGDDVSGMVEAVVRQEKTLLTEHCVEFFDVKFCPYQPLDRDPVFAAVSKKHASGRRKQSIKNGHELTISGCHM